MSITVKGVEVRPEEVNLEVKFQDLTAEGQKRVFLENKEDFLIEALNSQYSAIRRLLWETEVKEKCSSDVLNAAIPECIKRGALVEDIISLLNVPGFELNENIREGLTCSRDLHLRIWVAKDKKTSLQLLKKDEMFMNAVLDLVQVEYSRLFDAIVLNPNFEWDEEVEVKMKRFSPEANKIVRERFEFLKK